MISVSPEKAQKTLQTLLLIVTFSVPLYRFEVTSIGLAIPTILIGLTLSLWFLFFVSGLVSISSKNKLIVILLSVFLIAVLGYSTSISPITKRNATNTIPSFMNQIFYFLVPFLLIDNTRRLKAVVRSYFYGGIIIVFSVILIGRGFLYLDFARLEVTRVGYTLGTTRTAGILTNFGDVSIYLSVMLIVLFLGLLSEKRSRPTRTILFLLTITAILFAQLYTQSRNVAVTNILVIIMVFFFLPLKSQNQRYLYISFFIFVSVLVGLIVFFNEELIRETILNPSFLRHGEGRVLQYELAIQGISKELFFGYGMGAFELIYHYPYDVHNTILQIIFSGGLTAFLIWVSILTIPFIRMIIITLNSYYLPRRISAFYYLTLLVIMFAGSFYPAQNSVISWYSLGLISAIPYLRDLHQSSEKR